MKRATFDRDDFLDAALAIVAERGPPAVTVASVIERINAPTGSFYHRFASRDVLLGELWLRTVLAFQEGWMPLLDAGDGLGAALYTPQWVRTHLNEACLLLLYHRDEFVQDGWPAALRAGVARQAQAAEAGIAKFAQDTFARVGPEEVRCAQFLLAEVPVAAVRQHLLRREPPPPMVDELIRISYKSVVDAYRAGAIRSPGGAAAGG